MAVAPLVSPVVQQSFFGASITNFSINIGFNSNSSSLNLSLVEDAFFREGKIPGINYGVARGSSVYEGYHNWDHSAHPYLVTAGGHDDCRQLQIGGTRPLATYGDRFCPPTPGEPAYFKYYGGDGTLVFSYNGIVNRYERSQGTSGTTYTVSINDPRMILEGSQLILDKYMGTTAPADASHGLVTSPFLRNYNKGWLGYYNIINVFGYYEGGFNYGAALNNEGGMPWLKVLDAMNIMLTSSAIPNTTLTGYMPNEPYGGPLYYLPKSAPGAPVSTYPVNAHRYKVDIRDLQLLSGTRGIGSIPDDFRVSGTSMTIMSFISQVCDVGAADFFIELQEDSPIAEYDLVGNLIATHSSPFSGVIKVRIIPRNRAVVLGKIRAVIDDATRHPNPATGLSTSVGPWANRVVSSSLGYEFADPEVGTMMIGAPRTRVIGVTPLGQANLRPEYGSGTDTLIEDYPDGEYDGAWLGLGGNVPGIKFPTDFSTYERAQQMDPPKPETEDTRNDAYLNWFWDKDDKDELHLAVGGQDGMIDMYPCWGFHTVTPVGTSHGAIVTVESKGMPILGKFHDDSPYRDFDEEKGIFSHDKDDGVIEWVKDDPKCTLSGGALGKYNRLCPASRSSSVPNNIFSVPRFRTQTSAGGSGSATCVLSSGFRSPASANIPIDLGSAGYSGGPTGTNGDFSNFYYATVTELRHVIKGKESWLRYMKEYQPFLPCHMGWNQYCPVKNPANVQQSGAAIKGAGAFDQGDNVVPADAAQQRQAGRQADARHSADTSVPGMEVADARGKALAAMVANQQDRAFRKISDIANNYYGKKYLVPLPYNGKFDVYGDLDNWIRRIDDRSMQFELRWDLSNSGWAGEIDITNAEVGKRYPHNINFYDEDGKLNAFMVFPTKEKMRCSKQVAYLDFGSVSPDAIHSTPLLNNSMGGGSEGKTYVKATVDTKTYWILDKSAASIHHNEVSEANIRPFALITISSPVHWSTDDSIRIGTNPSPPGGGPSTKKNMLIPLGGFADGRIIDSCNISAAIAGIYSQEIGGPDLAKSNSGPASGTGQTKMAPARYKPWACGVPQTSNRFTWGPWAAGVNFGKANFVDDSSYSPEAFGGVALMNLAARGKVITLNDPNVFIESGNVTVTGLPDYDYGIGAQIFGDGPTISDISVDIGPGGITTSYTMQTQQKFGEIQGIYENRIKKLQSDAMENSKKIAASLKKTKLISFRDLSSKFNK
jgi:hypothetical protein